MNSDPNSDFEQCTESKLGWMHSVHIQGVVSWRVGCHIVASLWSCHRRLLPCRNPPPPHAPYRRPCRDTRQWQGPPRALPLAPSTGQPCCASSWPYRRACSVVSQGPTVCSVALCPAVSRYSLLYRDLAPKWAVAHPATSCKFFFSLIFCFHLFYSLLDHKYIFFISSVEPKIFIYFFFCFTHCKTSEKKC